MNYMDQWGILAFMPFKKCEVQQNADELSVIDEITVKTVDHINFSGLEYECFAHFTKA